MENLEIAISSVEQLPSVASQILQFAGSKKVFAFYAEMGAGKTTLIKEICKQLGSHDNFSSPTYSIVNEYSIEIPNSPQDAVHKFQIPNPRLYHIDCYRLRSLDEALSVGMEEYLDGGSYCFIEWPELIETLLPPDVIKINIRTDGNVRNLTIFRD